MFILSSGLNSLAITKICPAGVPVGTFKLLVVPVKGGPALPLNAVNVLGPDQKLRYEPVKLPEDLKEKARVSVIIVPADNASKHLEVLPAQPVRDPAEWNIPERVSAVGVVFGPHGIDTKKVASLVQKHPEIVTKLADYAEQTTRVEALVKALSEYENSAPDSKSLQSVLQGFSSQYGVQIPVLGSKSSSQQALSLVRALAPAVAANDPIPSRSDMVPKTGGLAGSVAATYFGAPVALAIGGATLVQSLHSSLFPPTDFRSAFAQPSGSEGTNLCTAKAEDSKPRAQVDYLWMSRIPDEGAPKVSLVSDVHLPLGTSSTVAVATATVSQLESLSRARDWRLVSAAGDAAVPVKVETGTEKDMLILDLSHTKLPPGQYQLAAKWDWTPFEVEGTVEVRPLGNIADVKVAPESQDALVTGTGPVEMQLTGTDFEFVDSVTLQESKNSKRAVPLEFTLPQGKKRGEQAKMQTEIDTAGLAPGHYLLAIKQSNGVTGDVLITIHPPNPELTQVPLRVNTGEPEQTVVLHGKHLERIEKITGAGADWKLSDVPKGAADLTERSATVKLASWAKKGDRLSMEMVVSGLQNSVKRDDTLSVVGPRPKITSANKSFASQSGVELRSGEIPAGITASFSLQVENVDSHPSLELGCRNEADTRHKITLSPGDKTGSAELDLAGEGTLFLSVDAGSIGDSGCQLIAQVTEQETGSSDPFVLGRVIRLPRISNFGITDENLGNSIYAATLGGQDLQLVEKVGWSADNGAAVQEIPTPVPGSPQEQTLKIPVPWPPPSPKAPLYVWLRGESQARRTNAYVAIAH